MHAQLLAPGVQHLDQPGVASVLASTFRMGSDFYDWYMENVVESAEEIEPGRSLPIRLALPGFPVSSPPRQSCLVDSF